ncbi:hypothetical protein CL621_00050 [archaeon]|jgi:hypothetical protein|nr:hypothetical protein [archaeon]|tara:strand:+ start:612 stop:977 length:366 start_codon:yes stop_codon:yes gene_type:complete
MSLDVSLVNKNVKQLCSCCGGEVIEDEYVYEANITHNLGAMAREAGIYHHLWRPEELNITLAKDLIEPIREGLADMRERSDHYKKYNSENGWGLYKHFVPWIQNYLDACIENPNSIIEVSR